MPVEHQGEVKAAYWAIFDPTGEPPGERSIAVARVRAADFSATFGRRFPFAVACLNEDLPRLFAYLRFPVEHHKRIRHSNFIERTFGETCRRVKVMLYVAATRGKVSNRMYVDSSWDPDVATGYAGMMPPCTAREVLARILANEGAELSVHEVERREREAAARAMVDRAGLQDRRAERESPRDAVRVRTRTPYEPVSAATSAVVPAEAPAVDL